MQKIKRYIVETLEKYYSSAELKTITSILCTDVLALDKIDIYTCKDINLSTTQEDKLRDAVTRLLNNEPIQYVVGEAYFYGRPFFVKEGVLIPRPETEELVELILSENKGKYHLLDIGTGSGCIAISIAKEAKEARVEAWDISPQAVEVASFNNKALDANITIKQRDVLTFVPQDEIFDVIVSNPPYITSKEQEEMEHNVLDWEPSLALFVPDDNPLLFYEHIADLGLQMLRDGGKLYFEINQYLSEETASMLRMKGYKDVVILKDLYGNDRIIKSSKVL